MAIDSTWLFKTLVENEILDQQEIESIRTANPKAEYSVADVYELVSKGKLTRWQAKRLLDKKSNLRIGDYQILKYLGKDELGGVYLAQTKDKHQYRLRLVSSKLSPSELDSQIERAYSFQELADLPVVNVAQIFQMDGKFLIVSELASGKSLSRLFSESSIDSELADELILKLTQVVVGLQARQLEHGSIGARSIYLTDDHEILLDVPHDLGWNTKAQPELSDVAALGLIASSLSSGDPTRLSVDDNTVTQKYLKLDAPSKIEELNFDDEIIEEGDADDMDSIAIPELSVNVVPVEPKPTPVNRPTQANKITSWRQPEKPNFENLAGGIENETEKNLPKVAASEPGKIIPVVTDQVAEKSETVKADTVKIDAEKVHETKPGEKNAGEKNARQDYPDGIPSIPVESTARKADVEIRDGATPSETGQEGQQPPDIQVSEKGPNDSVPPVVLGENVKPDSSKGETEKAEKLSTGIKSTIGVLAVTILILIGVLTKFVFFSGSATAVGDKSANSNSEAKKVAKAQEVSKKGPPSDPNEAEKKSTEKTSDKSDETEKVVTEGDSVSKDAVFLDNSNQKVAAKGEATKKAGESGKGKGGNKSKASKEAKKATEPKDDAALLLIGKPEKKSEPAKGNAKAPAKMPNPFAALPRVATLPQINQDNQAAKPLFPLQLPKSMPLTVSLHGGYFASNSKIKFDLRTSTSLDQTWMVMAGPENELREVGRFSLDGDKFLFAWTRLATEIVNLADLRNCAIKLKAADFQKSVVLRTPVVAPALEFEKSLNASTQIKIDELPTLDNVHIVVVKQGNDFPQYSFVGGKNKMTGRADSLSVNFNQNGVEMINLEISSRVSDTGISIRAVASYVSPDKQKEKLTSFKQFEKTAEKAIKQCDDAVQDFKDFAAKAPQDNKAKAAFVQSQPYQDLQALSKKAPIYKKHIAQALEVARKLNKSKMGLRVYFQAEEFQVDLATSNGKPYQAPAPKADNKSKAPKKGAQQKAKK